MSGRLWEAQLSVFYVSGRFWELWERDLLVWARFGNSGSYEALGDILCVWNDLGGSICRILRVWKALGGSICRILRVWEGQILTDLSGPKPT